MEHLIFIFRQLHAAIPKRKLIFDMQFPFIPVGVKMEGYEKCSLSPSLD